MADIDVEKIIDWWEAGAKDLAAKRNAYWKSLSAVRREYDHDYPTDRQGFDGWLADMYGVKIHYEGANISGHFDILDEQKYTLFLLKYSGTT